MNTQPHPAINALIGAAGGGVSIIADYFTWLDPAIRAISFYGGAVLVIFSIVSVSLDIRRKWINRRERRERESD